MITTGMAQQLQDEAEGAIERAKLAISEGASPSVYLDSVIEAGAKLGASTVLRLLLGQAEADATLADTFKRLGLPMALVTPATPTDPAAAVPPADE